MSSAASDDPTHAAVELAEFVHAVTWHDLTAPVVEDLKVRILDSAGCCFGALDAEPIRALSSGLTEFGGEPLSTLLGVGRSSPDRAAFYNSALVRYLDFNDAYASASRGGGGHPSENLGAVLAVAELVDASGRDLLVALAIAYQVQCRLVDVATNPQRPFDYPTTSAYAVAAAAAWLLDASVEQTAHALAIAGASLVSLRVTRTGDLSHWKGLAHANTAGSAVLAAWLARKGITGPLAVFEGVGGFIQTMTNDFTIDWSKEDLGAVSRTILKKYNAQIHSQAPIEAMLELARDEDIDAAEIDEINLDIHQLGFENAGGGWTGSKKNISTKEAADHSLPYILAVAALDGQVLPDQYRQERILRDDVQQLMQRVTVRPAEDLTARFPEEHGCRLHVRLRDGRDLRASKKDYHGSTTRPMTRQDVIAKVNGLVPDTISTASVDELAERIWSLESGSAKDLAAHLHRLASASA